MAEEKNTEPLASFMKKKMAQFFEHVGKLSRRHRLFICLGTLALIGGGYYYFIFMPRHGQLVQAAQALEARTISLYIVQGRARSLPEWENRVSQVEAAFHEAARALPDNKALPSVLAEVSRAGSRAGVNFLLFQPDPEIAGDAYREIPLSIKVEGSYHQIQEFFFHVSRLNRIVTIRNISLRRNKSASGTIDMTCNAVTYMFEEEDPAENDAPQAGMPVKKPGTDDRFEPDRSGEASGAQSPESSREAAAEATPGYVVRSGLDPFLPLIQELAPVSPEPGRPADPGRILTPLEKMALTQVRLVAVVIAEGRKIAMVEEATGKGYEIAIGTHMGENGGQVVDISFDGIVVKEMVTGLNGSQTPHFQKIKFHKPDNGE